MSIVKKPMYFPQNWSRTLVHRDSMWYLLFFEHLPRWWIPIQTSGALYFIIYIYIFWNTFLSMGSNFEVYKVFRHVQLVSNFEVYSLYIYITIESRECSFWKYNQTLQETGLGAWERTSQWQRGHWNRFWGVQESIFQALLKRTTLSEPTSSYGF